MWIRIHQGSSTKGACRQWTSPPRRRHLCWWLATSASPRHMLSIASVKTLLWLWSIRWASLVLQVTLTFGCCRCTCIKGELHFCPANVAWPDKWTWLQPTTRSKVNLTSTWLQPTTRSKVNLTSTWLQLTTRCTSFKVSFTPAWLQLTTRCTSFKVNFTPASVRHAQNCNLTS